jgi:nicotinate-nucleotide pyrophosphorylase
VLLGWKVAQNLVEAASGMARGAAAIVDVLRAEGRTPLACTRKAPPGTHWWAAQAIEAGGAVMHRLGLSETLLVFPEHRALLPADEVAARLQALRHQQPEKRLVVETGPRTRRWPWPGWAWMCCSSNASRPRRWPGCTRPCGPRAWPARRRPAA